jgi:hypothetical protein
MSVRLRGMRFGGRDTWPDMSLSASYVVEEGCQ